MRFGNFHIGFFNDKKVVVREVVLNPAYMAFEQFEAVSQILQKIQGGLESLTYYTNNTTGISSGLTQKEVNRFMRTNLFAIYIHEHIEGEVFLHVTRDKHLYYDSNEEKGYPVSSVLFREWGALPSTMVENALKHYIKTISVDVSVLENSGFEGVISPQSNSFNGGLADDDVVEKIEGELNKNGLQKGQKKYIVTNTPYTLTQPKNELATLDFTAKQKQTFLTLCDKFGCPKELFAISDQSTYENRRLAMIDFYMHTILPYAEKVLEQVNKIEQDITTKPDTFYIAKNEIPEVAYEEKNAKYAGRANVDALVKLYDAGLMSAEEVRQNIGETFYLNNEQK